MSLFELMLKNYFDDEMLNKLGRVRILIAGCGGLGSNIAEILVRCGVKHLSILDFDTVDILNLNRQNYFFYQSGQPKVEALCENLVRINPYVSIRAIKTKIDDKNIDELILEHDIIVEAVDDEYAKSLIFIRSLEKGKKVVAASGVAGFGDCESIKIMRGKNYSVVGDFSSSVKDKKPYAPKVMAVASIQADEVLRMVSKLE